MIGSTVQSNSVSPRSSRSHHELTPPSAYGYVPSVVSRIRARGVATAPARRGRRRACGELKRGRGHSGSSVASSAFSRASKDTIARSISWQISSSDSRITSPSTSTRVVSSATLSASSPAGADRARPSSCAMSGA